MLEIGTHSVAKLTVTEKDRFVLAHRRQHVPIRNHAQPVNYRDKVVVKPWGHEFLVFENRDVAVWLLHINKDHATSLHCHPLKKTALTLLSGRAMVNSFQFRKNVVAGDTVLIPAGAFHSTKALCASGITLVEVETPPCKTDLVRFEDNYGREMSGYEGYAEMVTDNLEKYEYFVLDNTAGGRARYASPQGFTISLLHFTDSFRQAFFPINNAASYCVINGALYGNHGQVIVPVGDTASGPMLASIPGLCATPEITVLEYLV